MNINSNVNFPLSSINQNLEESHKIKEEDLNWTQEVIQLVLSQNRPLIIKQQLHKLLEQNQNHLNQQTIQILINKIKSSVDEKHSAEQEKIAQKQRALKTLTDKLAELAENKIIDIQELLQGKDFLKIFIDFLINNKMKTLDILNYLTTDLNIKDVGILKQTIIQIGAWHPAELEDLTTIDMIDEKDRAEIIKSILERYYNFNSYHLDKFNITQDHLKIDIIKYLIEHNVSSVASYMDRLNISQEEARIEIALLVASRYNISTDIEKFKIKDEKALFQIAKLNIPHLTNIYDVQSLLEKCHITDDNKKLELALYALPNFNHAEDDLLKTITGLDEKALFDLIQENANKFYPLFSVSHEIFNQYKELQETEKSVERDLELSRLKKKLYGILYSYLVLNSSHINLTDEQKAHEVWNRIMLYPDQMKRYEFSDSMLPILENRAQWDHFNSLCQTTQHMLLPSIFLTQLGQSENMPLLQKLISENRDFRDIYFLKNLLDTMSILIKRKELTHEEIIAILKNALLGKTKDTIKTNLFTIQGIIQCNGIEGLKKTAFDSNQNLEDIYLKAFKQIVPVKDRPNFDKQYLLKFGPEKRVSQALITYAGRLSQLRTEEKEKALQSLAVYVDHVLDNQFQTIRYDEQKSLHLQQIFTSRPDLKQLWKEGKEISLNSFLASQEQKKIFSYAEFFTDPIATRFFDSEEYFYIKEFINTSNAENKQAVVNSLIAKMRSLSKQKEKDQQLLSELHLQKLMIDLIDNAKDELNSLKQIENALARLKISNEFSAKIKARIKQIKDEVELQKGFTLVDTDDYWDLLLCGTEVKNSCQKVDGEPHYVKCLLAYLLDGKHRLIALKDSDGKIVGRAILRILWDKNEQKPVLLQEKIYTHFLQNSEDFIRIQNQLNLFIQSRAKALKLSLFKEGEQPINLESKENGYGSWEYVDSLNSLHVDYRVSDNGIYEITKAEQVIKNI